MDTLKRKIDEAMQEKFVGNFEFTEGELDSLFAICKKVLISYELGDKSYTHGANCAMQ